MDSRAPTVRAMASRSSRRPVPFRLASPPRARPCMHVHAAATLGHMATTIQVRSVDEGLARAAKERASATHRSLSTYIKDLISADLEAAGSAERMSALLTEIRRDNPRVSREETAAALRDVRREMGTV